MALKRASQRPVWVGTGWAVGRKEEVARGFTVRARSHCETLVLLWVERVMWGFWADECSNNLSKVAACWDYILWAKVEVIHGASSEGEGRIHLLDRNWRWTADSCQTEYGYEPIRGVKIALFWPEQVERWSCHRDVFFRWGRSVRRKSMIRKSSMTYWISVKFFIRQVDVNSTR